MKIIIITFVVIIVLLIVWIIGTLLAIRGIESPKYQILENKGGYEIRKYNPYIVAEVEVTGNYQQGLTRGFSILAGYIFGGNIKNESISMTSPVTESLSSSEKISMTTPVGDINSGDTRIIQFSMPAKYTLESLPIPDNKNIVLREVPGYTAAVLTYRGYATENRITSQKSRLLKALSQDAISDISEPISAQYNPPLSFPLLRRNEIIIPIEY